MVLAGPGKPAADGAQLKEAGSVMCLGRPFAPALALALLAGCAALPPEEPFPLTPSGVSAAFPLPSARERMIYLARQEWTLFGRPVVDYASDPPTLKYPPGMPPAHETQPPLLSRVFLYWYGVSPLPALGDDGELRPWSAAFIVWLARGAGIRPSRLPSTVLHWDYIDHALTTNAYFSARDARLHAPRPGDLLCAPRGDEFVAEVDSFERLRRGPYHCDLVVEQRPDQIDVIGGNVHDSVALTHIALDNEGRALPTPERHWVVVLTQPEKN